MLRFLADENFNAAVVRGLLLRLPALDIVTVQEIGLAGAPDAELLDWAARNHRLLVTHDVSTIPEYVRERVEAGLPMPGVVEVGATAALARVIDDILLVAQASLASEWANQIVHVPL